MLKISFFKSIYTNVHKRGLKVPNVFIDYKSLILNTFPRQQAFSALFESKRENGFTFCEERQNTQKFEVEKFSVIWMGRSKQLKVIQRHKLLFWKDKSLKIA